MVSSNRKIASVVAACSLCLALFGTCVDAGHAAPRVKHSIVSNAHPQSAKTRHAKGRVKRKVASAPRRLRMIATAYAAGCDGCSGTTKTGAQASHGIVAVDPHFIPLGTRLYVPGYGRAVAGDTGGAIRGRRIDLGFDSLRQAQSFGRRQIVVYVLRGREHSNRR
jgi:3D (Asp-Asp-Asp) domain-containing protein